MSDLPTVPEAIRAILESSAAPVKTSVIALSAAEMADSTEGAVRKQLRNMLDRGDLFQPAYGLYRIATEADRAAAAGPARIRNIKDVQGMSADEAFRYPVLEGGGVSAGEGAVQYEAETYITAPRDIVSGWTGGRVPNSEDAYWTKVRGTSMEPWLRDGAPIFVSRCTEVLDGGRYVLYLDDSDAEVVKRVIRLGGGALLIISDNPSHPDRTLRHIEEDMYTDEEYGLTVRVRIQGVVLYPDDTGNAIVQMMAKNQK